MNVGAASGDDASFTTPRQVSLRRAARAPRGNAPEPWYVALEIIVIVVIPLALPNLAIFLARAEITLLELSFGFVALAVAILTKTLTAPTLAWSVDTALAFLLTVGFVTVAMRFDSHSDTARLVELSAQGEPGVVASSSEIARIGSDIVALTPTPLQWISTCLLGLALVILTTYLIVKRDS